MRNAGWKRILRIMDEAYADYLTGMAALRKRVVGDLKRKLSDGEVLDRPHLEPSSPRERPASAARHPRPRRPIVHVRGCSLAAPSGRGPHGY